LRLASLFSGGKDSTYSIFKMIQMGHDVVCLITLQPQKDDSLLFHYPNSHLTKQLGEAIDIPSFGFPVKEPTKQEELSSLAYAVKKAKADYDIQGLVHGGISSDFQKDNFQRVCSKEGLQVFAPLWGLEPSRYMHDLIDNKFCIKIVGVSAMGLDQNWLGMTLDKYSLDKLEYLSRKYAFNLAFEGGEGETLIVDCPIFKKRLEIKDARIKWDGQRGIFEILEVALISK
jgi:ABC transporter with metal-binding/Fe-S-binding domain ATP-binding protein